MMSSSGPQCRARNVGSQRHRPPWHRPTQQHVKQSQAATIGKYDVIPHGFCCKIVLPSVFYWPSSSERWSELARVCPAVQQAHLLAAHGRRLAIDSCYICYSASACRITPPIGGYVRMLRLEIYSAKLASARLKIKPDMAGGKYVTIIYNHVTKDTVWPTAQTAQLKPAAFMVVSSTGRIYNPRSLQHMQHDSTPPNATNGKPTHGWHYQHSQDGRCAIRCATNCKVPQQPSC